MKTAIFTVAILVLVLATVATAADPFVGTWKMNVAKSKVGGTAPKSETVNVTVHGSGFNWTFDTVQADGKAMRVEWSGNYDGKDYAITGEADSNTAATSKINANTLNSVGKKDGKVVESMRIVVSKDGKTLTITDKLKNAQGQEVTTFSIYDRQ